MQGRCPLLHNTGLFHHCGRLVSALRRSADSANASSESPRFSPASIEYKATRSRRTDADHNVQPGDRRTEGGPTPPAYTPAGTGTRWSFMAIATAL